MIDFYIHLRYRVIAHDGYELWRYERIRFSDMNESVKSLRSKGGRQFSVRPLNTQERWRWFGAVQSQ